MKYSNTITNKTALEFKKLADKHKLTFTLLHKGSFQLSNCTKKILFFETMPETTSAPMRVISQDKIKTKKLLDQFNIPTLNQLLLDKFNNDSTIKQFILTHKKVVVKPLRGMSGNGITTNISNLNTTHKAINFAQNFDPMGQVFLEEYYSGNDYRFFVVGKKHVFVTKKIPAHIIGNGKDTVLTLIHTYNSLSGAKKILSLDSRLLTKIKSQNVTIETVLEKDKKIFLSDVSNLKAGGSSEIFTHKTPPHMIELAKKIAIKCNLDVIGIDIMSINDDFKNPRIIEINTNPGIRLHMHPTYGKPENVCESIVQYFFEK